uniref:Uncharacterized protein n=1 Tax=Physcomitrium patens TaxID=3218 RepID=A0A2K1LB58_PHYPA|nr:hypothetical protein PHYPA_001678 [Physcomitrium patens]
MPEARGSHVSCSRLGSLVQHLVQGLDHCCGFGGEPGRAHAKTGSCQTTWTDTHNHHATNLVAPRISEIQGCQRKSKGRLHDQPPLPVRVSLDPVDRMLLKLGVVDRYHGDH